MARGAIGHSCYTAQTLPSDRTPLTVILNTQATEKANNQRVFLDCAAIPLTIGINCASSSQKSKSAPILALPLTFVLSDTYWEVSMTDYFHVEGI